MRMTDADPVCDTCGVMWPDEYVELWPAQVRGAYGPDRIRFSGFGVCADCLRAIFGPVRRAAAEDELRRHRERGPWLTQAYQRRLAVSLAEAIVRDAELGSAA